MIGFLAPFFLRAGLGEKGARLASIGLLAFVAVAALAFVVMRIRADAVRDERARVELVRQAAELAQRANERAAEDMRRRELAAERRLSEQRRREIDDATRNIPDQGLSARQRAILCVELRRQGAPERDLAAACGPVRAP